MSDLDRISFDNLPHGPGVRIVRAEQAKAWQEGLSFLEEVRAAAGQIEETARNAYAAEYAKGYEEGRLAGAGEATRMVGETTLKVNGYVKSLEPQIAGLALRIVNQILGEFPADELVARAAAQAVAEFCQDNSLNVTVHPQAVERVRAALAPIIEETGLAITVRADPDLDHTSCIVASEFAVVDASIETQLDAIRRGLGAAPSAGASSTTPDPRLDPPGYARG